MQALKDRLELINRPSYMNTDKACRFCPDMIRYIWFRSLFEKNILTFVVTFNWRCGRFQPAVLLFIVLVSLCNHVHWFMYHQHIADHWSVVLYTWSMYRSLWDASIDFKNCECMIMNPLPFRYDPINLRESDENLTKTLQKLF